MFEQRTIGRREVLVATGVAGASLTGVPAISAQRTGYRTHFGEIGFIYKVEETLDIAKLKGGVRDHPLSHIATTDVVKLSHKQSKADVELVMNNSHAIFHDSDFHTDETVRGSSESRNLPVALGPAHLPVGIISVNEAVKMPQFNARFQSDELILRAQNKAETVAKESSGVLELDTFDVEAAKKVPEKREDAESGARYTTREEVITLSLTPQIVGANYGEVDISLPR